MSLPPASEMRAHSRPTVHRLGPFITRAAARLADGSSLVATSRRHRKGLAPHTCSERDAHRIPPTRRDAWRRFWAPSRLAWWIAVSFVIGSACFVLAGWAVTWPPEVFAPLRLSATANAIFFAGSLFFTAAACLQLLEATHGDVAEALGSRPAGLHWLGFRPRNLGWLASASQLGGTVAFNIDTGAAMISGLDWQAQDLWVWTPNALGCAGFLVSSALAWLELSHGAWSFAPRSASWWSVALNASGSLAFALSAAHSLVGPGRPDPCEVWLAGFYTVVGALCFLAGSYLLIPELFDEETCVPAMDATRETA